MRHVDVAPGFETWQAAARALLREGVAPADVVWHEVAAIQPRLPDGTGAPGAGGAEIRVPRRFVELARTVARHHDPARWSLLYDVLWRLVHVSRDLLEREADPAIGRLLRLEREAGRLAPEGAGALVPAGADLAALGAAAARCAGCELHRHATQTVFGRGPGDARVVLVGEQPGDQEDLRGAPFVGPAGEVLDRALAEAGMDRGRVYVTNAVKHFKFVARGKRRIHQTPRAAEVLACRPWLEAELELIRPRVLVCLGATAARALLGPDFRLMQARGRFVETRWAPRTLATLHPSAVLRGEDEPAQARLYAMLVQDLRLAASAA